MKKVDEKELGKLIHRSNKILKILYIVIIILGIYGLTIITKELKIGNFLLEVLKIVAPLFIGLVIAWLFNPLVNKLQKKGLNRTLSSTLIYIIGIGAIILIISLITPMLLNQLNDFVKGIPSIIDSIRSWIDSLFSKIGGSGNFNAIVIKNNIFAKLEQYAYNLSESLPSTSLNIIRSLFSGLSTFFVGLIIGFFLLVSFDNVNNLFAFLPENIKKDTDDIFSAIDGSLRKFVEGTLILSTLVFLASALGFWVSDLKYPLLFGLFCGITNVIPFVGPYLGGAPAVIVGFSQGPLVGIGVLITIIIVQFIEGNLLQPIVMSKTMKLHPVSIILGLLVFGHFWGIIGMIVATPIVAIIKIVFNYFDKKYKLINKNKDED